MTYSKSSKRVESDGVEERERERVIHILTFYNK